MPVAITTGLDDLFADSITVQAVTRSGLYREWVASGSSVAYDCYISGKTRMVRDFSGEEVVASLKVIIPSTPTLTTNLHRYTLPARYTPNEDLRAISVKVVQDENGPHHVVLHFP